MGDTFLLGMFGGKFIRKLEDPAILGARAPLSPPRFFKMFSTIPWARAGNRFASLSSWLAPTISPCPAQAAEEGSESALAGNELTPRDHLRGAKGGGLRGIIWVFYANSVLF
jgi:hypothetical protein